MSTTTYNPDLKEAFEYEQLEIGENLEDLMAQFLEASGKDSGASFDEMKIRRMMFAVKYLEEEEDRLKRLKAAVVAEWDQRIAVKKENATELKEAIRDYLKDHNGGKGLSLDIGTISLRKKKANLKKVDSKKVRSFFAERGELASFLKPGELDVTLAKNDLLKKLENKEITLEEITEFGTYEKEDKSISIKFK